MHLDTAARTMPPSSTLPLANIEASLLQLLAELDQIDNEHQLMQTVLDAVTQMIPCRQAFLYEWDDEAGQGTARGGPESMAGQPTPIPRRHL